jgi:hypothetical protein
MKYHIILAVLAACFGAPPGFRTANTTEPPPQAVDPEVQKQLDEQADQLDVQAEKIAELEKQLALSRAATSAPISSNLALLCKGAGVDTADVRWRVAAGLDDKQAVDAAVSQKASDAQASRAMKKGGK